MHTAQQMKFSIKDFFSKCDHNPQETADLVTFTEEIVNGKLHFFCSSKSKQVKQFKMRPMNLLTCSENLIISRIFCGVSEIFHM